MKRTKLKDRILPPYTKGEEIFNMTSHIVGAAMGIVAIFACVIKAALGGNILGIVTGAIFGLSMIIVYTCSSVYHGLSPKLMSKKVLQIIDHCSIYILIAGTYTPFTLSLLRVFAPGLGWSIFGFIWGFAILGITLNSIDLKKYKTFSMITYIGMGWFVISAWRELAWAMGMTGFGLLLGGGIAYTLGAILYVVGKRMKLKYIHSVFHIFTVIGSLLHFLCIFIYVM